MTVQKAKEELTCFNFDKKELQKRKEAILELEMRLRDGRIKRMDNAVCALVDLKEHYDKQVSEIVHRNLYIDKKISCLPQPYRSILYMYYIQGHPLHRISAELYYGYTYTSRLHTVALQKYAELCNKNTEDMSNGLA